MTADMAAACPVAAVKAPICRGFVRRIALGAPRGCRSGRPHQSYNRRWGPRMAVGILGTGSYLPEREVTNADLAAMVPGADPEWVSRKTLIQSRRFAAPDEATSDLAAKAA